ncbi:MAG: ATP-binding protein [Phycisphaerales bacterium]
MAHGTTKSGTGALRIPKPAAFSRRLFMLGLVAAGGILASVAGEGLEKFVPAVDSVEWHASLALGALIVVAVMFLRTVTAARSAEAIRAALAGVPEGRVSREDLLIDGEACPESAAWNMLIEELQSLRDRRLDERVGEALEAGAGAADGFGFVCDSLWLGLTLLGEDGRVTYANGAAGVLLQTPRETLVGSRLDELVPTPEAIEAIGDVVAGRSRRRVSIEIDRLGGEEGGEAAGVLRLTIRPTPQAPGAVALVVIEDVTQQRVADKSRNAFVANATHELRTPLTNIRLYVEEAQDANGDEQVIARSLNVISTEVRRLDRIVGDMLSASEIEAGSISLRESDVRMDALLEELRHDYGAQATEKEITLTFDLPPKLPVLQGDRDKIAMALHNLVGNALKYTPKGGSVTLRAVEEPERFRIDVVDTGIGIAEEDRPRVFEKFYRAKDGRIKDITGSGIGLSLARDVIRLHGGDITLDSEIDEGSTFTLSLPARPAAA